jgi:hypothetical protein
MNKQNNLLDNESSRNLFKEFEIDKLPIEEQKRVLLKINKVILTGVMSKAVDNLSKERQTIIEKKVEEGLDEIELLNLLKEHVPNFDDLIDQEIEDFKNLSLNIADKIKDKKNKD